MAQPVTPARSSQTKSASETAGALRGALSAARLFGAENEKPFRIATRPYSLSPKLLKTIQALGPALLEFTTALNRLYFASVKGQQPEWVAGYLDQGKPDAIVMFNRMNRFKSQIPGVIRPDLILTEAGLVATELDAVPGGIGLTGCMARQYSDLGSPVIGGRDGMVEEFAGMIRDVAENPKPALGIVVSDESADYRPEMRWLGEQLSAAGLPTRVVEPKAVRFSEEGLSAEGEGAPVPIDVLYRFFELFDLKNIPKAELMLYAAKKGAVKMTPPPKTPLEEKMAMGLYFHPVLRAYWEGCLSKETIGLLDGIFPETWIVDPRPVPPHAVIPGLKVGNQPVRSWRDLANASQKERQLILKPSGFSELAWGSRGVVAGHDLSAEDWGRAIDEAMAGFPESPHILQRFHKGATVETDYFGPDGETIRMPGRARISPYYFVKGETVSLGGVLATICPVEKKLIHGMTEAVMVPCGAADGG